jgi:uncharacterized protein YbjT (DUF2867 family)
MIVVLGAGGFVGQHLVSRLASAGEPLRVTVRARTAAAQLARLGAQPVLADVRDPHSLRRALHGARVVINLVTITKERKRGDFRAVHWGGIANIVSAARDAGVDRVLHVGALADVEAGSDSGLAYLYYKQRGTEELQRSGLRYTIFETSIVFGKGDQQMSAIALLLKRLPFFPIPGPLAAATRFQPIWVGDLVECLVRAIDDEASVGRTFPLGGPDAYSYRELVRLSQVVLGTRRRVIFVPHQVARAVLAVAERFMRHPPITAPLVDLAGVDSVADSRDTYRHFGIDPARLSDNTAYLAEVDAGDLRRWTSGRRRRVAAFRRNDLELTAAPAAETSVP